MKLKVLALLVVMAIFVAGCGDCDEETISFPTGPVTNGATGTAVDDAYSATSNTALVVNAAGGVLVNDTAGGTAGAFQNPTAQGGVVVGSGDGSFTYTPANGFVGVDTFTYTAQYPGNQSTATVTVTVVPNAIFVDNTAPNGGDGSFGARFNTIAAALALAAPGDTIFVFRGDGTNNGLAGPVNLQNNQRLVGEGAGLGVLAQSLGAPGGFPVFSGPINLADGNTVQGVRVENSPGFSIDADGSNGGTIVDNQIVNAGDEAVTAIGCSGNWTVSRNTIMNSVGSAVIATTNGNSMARMVFDGNTITGNTGNALGFIAGDASNLAVQATNNVMTGNAMNGTFEVIVGGTAVYCLDLTSNTNDDVYRLSRNVAGSTLNVEQLSQVPILNNGTPVITNPGSLPATEVAEGFCGF